MAVGRVKAPSGYKLSPEFIEVKSRRVQLVLQPSLYERLKAQSEKQGISVNELAHIAFEHYLEKIESEYSHSGR